MSRPLSDKQFDAWAFAILGGVCVLIAFGIVGCEYAIGVDGFGPVRDVTATVTAKHVDAGKNSSSYMLTTDHGTYEVDNGIVLGLWNADEMYGSIQVGKTYKLRVKGNRIVNILVQSYPYVLKAEEVAK